MPGGALAPGSGQRGFWPVQDLPAGRMGRAAVLEGAAY